MESLSIREWASTRSLPRWQLQALLARTGWSRDTSKPVDELDDALRETLERRI